MSNTLCQFWQQNWKVFTYNHYQVCTYHNDCRKSCKVHRAQPSSQVLILSFKLMVNYLMQTTWNNLFEFLLIAEKVKVPKERTNFSDYLGDFWLSRDRETRFKIWGLPDHPVELTASLYLGTNCTYITCIQNVSTLINFIIKDSQIYHHTLPAILTCLIN